MKFIIFLLIVVSAAAAYLYFNPADRPDIVQEWVKGTPLQPPPTKTYVYKWQDANGQWQITDKAPQGNIKYQKLEYSSDTNIVPSIPVDEN